MQRFLLSLLGVIAFLLLVGGSSRSSSGYRAGDVLRPKALPYRAHAVLASLAYDFLPVGVPFRKEIDAKVNGKLFSDFGLTESGLLPTAFEFQMLQDVKCALLGSYEFTEEVNARAKMLIQNHFRGRMMLEGIPLLSKGDDSDDYFLGYPLGVSFKRSDKYTVANVYIYNHFSFVIRYANVAHSELLEVTGFSVRVHGAPQAKTCTRDSFEHDYAAAFLNVEDVSHEQTIQFTYSVKWERNENGFPLHQIYTKGERGHYLKIATMNGILFITLVGLAVAAVVIRSIRKDLAINVEKHMVGKVREDIGSRSAHDAAFCAPPRAVLLVSLIGAGIQVSFTAFFTSLFAAIQIIPMSQPRTTVAYIVAVFFASHFPSALAVAWLLKLFAVSSYRKGLVATCALPMALGAVYLMMSLIFITKYTVPVISFTEGVTLLVAWCTTAVPLAYAGLLYGFRLDQFKGRAMVSNIPYLISSRKHKWASQYVIIGGFFPFLICCVELSYIFSAFWLEEQFLFFSLLTAFVVLTLVLCAEIGAVTTYFTLCSEDSGWWWRSFTALFSSSMYLGIYSCYYLVRYMQMELLSSVLLYFIYVGCFAVLFGLAAGSIGLFSSLFVLGRLYHSVKYE